MSKVIKFIKKIPHYIVTFLTKAGDDNLSAWAAQATFFVLLSFFPFVILLFMVATKISYFMDIVMRAIYSILPEDICDYIRPIVEEITNTSTGSFTIITALVCLWSAGKGIQAITYGLNNIYRVPRIKNYFVARIVGAFYTIILFTAIFAVMLLRLFGSRIAAYMVRQGGAAEAAANAVLMFKEFYSLGIIILVILAMYYQLPTRKGKFRQELIGAVIAAVVFQGVTSLFTKFMSSLSGMSYMYGSLTSLVLAIIWLYTEMQIILYGAEINYFYNEYRERKRQAQLAGEKSEIENVENELDSQKDASLDTNNPNS